ncbi:MAG: DbpA RNA binding domain-containing protein, partial [Methylomonas sp.]
GLVIDDAELAEQLQQIINQQPLNAQRALIKALSAQLGFSTLDFAAALLYAYKPSPDVVKHSAQTAIANSRNRLGYRSVRYRLDVGSQHHVTKDQIQAILIEESGVDKKRIGRIDIRHNYTLVELPDGMPADIFQLLSEATVADRKLALKRVKSNRRRPREA